MRRIAVAFAAIIVALLSAPTTTARSTQPRQLTFEDRVRAEEAIERVYYSHQIGATRPFEQAVPREVIDEKVRAYLEESVALERFWSTPVTSEALRAELDRIAARTRLPEWLREVYAALGDDSFVILETFARASLVERLSHGFFAADVRVKGRSWDEWWASARVEFDVAGATAVVGESVLLPLPASAASCAADDTWSGGTLDDMPEGRAYQRAVWTGSIMIIWGGVTGYTAQVSGARYDPLTDTWSRTSTTDAPSADGTPPAVWTGSEMIVWGGLPDAEGQHVGSRYDPISDTWKPMTAQGAPYPRYSHSAVWTGREMIVWGGQPVWSSQYDFDDGARYDPVSDTWTPISALNVPAARSGHAAVWTGSEMIVWGGWGDLDSGERPLTSGGIYSPATNSWRPMALSGAPDPRFGHSAVWTGSEMIVWGGGSDLPLCCHNMNSGARYDPAADTWAPTSQAGAPEARFYHSAIWTGNEMIVWGGSPTASYWPTSGLQTGGRYDPGTDTWTPTSLAGGPSSRYGHTAIWTGEKMIVWGGGDPYYRPVNTGGRYDPSSDTWTPTATSMGGPDPVLRPQAVWTGSEMIVWGGNGDCFTTCPASGGRYDPLLDRWRSITGVNAPSPRYDHAVAWTGSQMIVWGGSISSPPGISGEGGRYDPISDTWTAMSNYGAPAARAGALSVWTGRELIVWSGAGGSNTGGRYDPVVDRWEAMATSGAPEARTSAAAVWTGREMIVWGGSGASSGNLGSGGRYDPGADRWSPTSPLDPLVFGRNRPTAVWTGREMIIWGGEDRHGWKPPWFPIYDPDIDSWRLASIYGTSPGGRTFHSAIWTGSRMVVWGGVGYSAPGTNSGGLYDPSTDSWAAMSALDSPTGREQHAAVWTGSTMIIWGGYNSGWLTSGDRYAMEQSVDNDGDGFSECAGDCNDSNVAVYPGAPQVCGDGFNNDCLDPGWPALAGTNETDDDGDGFTLCGGDCDDGDPSMNPTATELPGNARDENCDGALACDPRAEWKNHGQFVRCVARECERLVESDLVTPQQCAALVSKAARLRGTGR